MASPSPASPVVVVRSSMLRLGHNIERRLRRLTAAVEGTAPASLMCGELEMDVDDAPRPHMRPGISEDAHFWPTMPDDWFTLLSIASSEPVLRIRPSCRSQASATKGPYAIAA
jgi:hypothetical protein